MVRKIVTAAAITSVAASALALSTPAVAAGGWDRDAGRGYDYARVVDVDPIVRRVRVDVPVEECWNEARYERGRPASNAGRAVVGGLIGAVVGNQFGSGDGRKAATVAGALLGGAIGHETANRRNDRRDYEPGAYEVERCATRYEQRFDERIDGYRVTYVYNGRHYTTRTAEDPGNRIRVQVDVHPVAFRDGY